MSSFRSLTDAVGFTTPAAPRTPATQYPRTPVEAKAQQEEGSAALVVMLVDRSGSMSSMGTEVVGGCNAFLDKQRETDAQGEQKVHLIAAAFDDDYNIIRNKPLAECAQFDAAEIQPRGMTALYDAITKVLDQATEVANGRARPFEAVTVFILTDGLENSSKSTTKEQVTGRITKLEKEFGWEFYFAAANQDAMRTGTSLGVKGAQCVTFNSSAKGACEAAFRTTSSKVAAVRSGDYASATYTQEEMDECMTGVLQ